MEAIHKTGKHNYKLTKEEFWAILKENFCLFSDTAKAIRQKFGIPYTRQAVEQRAVKLKKEIEQYKAETQDLAHRTVLDAMEQDKNMGLKYRAALYVLEKMNKNKGRQASTKKNK